MCTPEVVYCISNATSGVRLLKKKLFVLWLVYMHLQIAATVLGVSSSSQALTWLTMPDLGAHP